MVNPVRSEILSACQNNSIELAGLELKALRGHLSWALDGGHGERVRRYVRLLGLELGLSAEEAACMGSAATHHDIGKIGLPDSLLQKPGPLDAAEWEIVKKHPVIGAALLSGSDTSLLSLARLIALTHHEHWDGSGYPSGLKGESIPLAGQIAMLADRYDALRSSRPYKSALSHERTCEILLHGDGRSKPEHFDPRVLNAFRDSRDQFCEIQRKVHRRYAESPELIAVNIRQELVLSEPKGEQA
jgi:putative two-component system response regulator